MAGRDARSVLAAVEVLLRKREDRTDGDLLRAFLDTQDEGAFAALVQRHGTMIFAVCRRILDNADDADDAVQATFLVLATKASALKSRASLGAWLHGVARRTALNARRCAARRRDMEKSIVQAGGRTDDPMTDLVPMLDEELARLPDKYRLPIVLCDLEGRTRKLAAQQLRWPEGTVACRLTRGRQLLAQRLTKRGVALTGAALVTAMTSKSAGAWVATLPIARAAIQFLANGSLAGTNLVSAKVLALTQSVLKTMLLSKLKAMTALSLLSLSLAWGAGAIIDGPVGAQPAQAEKGPAKTANAPGFSQVPIVQRTTELNPKPASEAVASGSTDRFGDLLPPGAVARLGTLRWRQGGEIGQFAIAPDEKTVATTGYDDLLSLWELPTGKVIRSFRNVTFAGGAGVAYSPDGKFLVAGQRSEIRRWDTTTWVELPEWPVTPATAERLLYSPNGEFLACLGHTEGNRNAVLVFDAATGRQLSRLDGKAFYERPSIAFAPDGQSWAYADKSDKTIALYESRSGKEMRRFEGHPEEAMTVAFSPDGRTLASTDSGGLVRFWSTETSKLLSEKGRFRARYSLTYSPDGKRLASSSGLYDIATAKEQSFAKPGPGGEGVVHFSPKGKYIVSKSNSCLQVWDGVTLKSLQIDDAHNRQVDAVSFSGDGNVIASAAGNWGSVQRWEAATGKPLPSFRVDRDLAYGLAYSPDGRTLAIGTGNNQGSIWLLDAETGKRLRTIDLPKSYVVGLAFSADGRSLLSVQGNDAKLWDVATWKELRTIPGGSFDGRRYAVSADGQTIAGNPARGAITLWDTATGNERHTLPAYDRREISAIAFSPYGKMLAVGSDLDAPLKLWDGAAGTSLWDTKEQLRVSFLAFSPDGKTLVSGGRNGDVRLWEVETGQERWRFDGHRHGVRSGAFSRDGKRLVTGSHDTTALVWDLAAPARPARKAPLSARDLDELWSDLAADDAKKAYRAIAILAEESVQSLALLQKSFKVIQSADNPEIGQLLAKLDNDRFTVRDDAMRKLAGLGSTAEAALRKALAGQPTLEAKRRIEELLGKLEPRHSPDALRELRTLEVLERIGSAAARGIMESIAAGGAGARRTREAKASLMRWGLTTEPNDR